jgi:hypothetical protein
MAETTRTAEQQEQERQRQAAERATPQRAVPRGQPQQAGERAPRERDATDAIIQENLAKPPEPPTPTQDEADAMKEAAFSGNLQPEEPPAPETEEQRRERERRERDVKPAASGAGYTTR